jgi:hypothetical protein
MRKKTIKVAKISVGIKANIRLMMYVRIQSLSMDRRAIAMEAQAGLF